MEKTFDTHHILPTSRNWSQSRSNKVRLDIRKHRALHMLFDNRTPVEQIERLMSINVTALTLEFRNDVSRILEMAKDDEYVYEKWILVRK